MGARKSTSLKLKLKSQAVAYAVKVVMSRKWRKIDTDVVAAHIANLSKCNLSCVVHHTAADERAVSGNFVSYSIAIILILIVSEPELTFTFANNCNVVKPLNNFSLVTSTMCVQ